MEYLPTYGSDIVPAFHFSDALLLLPPETIYNLKNRVGYSATIKFSPSIQQFSVQVSHQVSHVSVTAGDQCINRGWKAWTGAEILSHNPNPVYTEFKFSAPTKFSSTRNRDLPLPAKYLISRNSVVFEMRRPRSRATKHVAAYSTANQKHKVWSCDCIDAAMSTQCYVVEILYFRETAQRNSHLYNKVIPRFNRNLRGSILQRSLFT